MFEELELLGNTIVLLVSLIILDRAGDWALTNSVKVADITGVEKTTIGFILVAFNIASGALRFQYLLL
jgi:Ca2+/Na+ antiporter